MDWPGALIPEFVRNAANFAVGVVSRSGALIDANFGFANLLPHSMTVSDVLDIRSLFSEPRFEDLWARRGERPGGTLYEGILHFGGGSLPVCSLHGAVYDWKDALLIVGEHEVGGLQLLRARLADLGETLIEGRSQLEAALRDADRQKAIAEDALAELAVLRRRLREVPPSGSRMLEGTSRNMPRPVVVRSRVD